MAIGACSRRDWRTASLESVKIDPREIQRKLAICLPNNHYAVRSAEKWIVETITLRREKYGFLFKFSRNEEEFLDCLLDSGDVDAELLDVAPDIQERIATMPMLAWKSRNVHIAQTAGVTGCGRLMRAMLMEKRVGETIRPYLRGAVIRESTVTLPLSTKLTL